MPTVKKPSLKVPSELNVVLTYRTDETNPVAIGFTNAFDAESAEYNYKDSGAFESVKRLKYKLANPPRTRKPTTKKPEKT